MFVSGLTPMDRRTGKIPLVTVDKQARMVLENMKVCLKAAGSSFDNVVKCTVYITNSAYFDEVNKVYRKYFKRNQPARVFCVVGSWPRRSSTSRSTPLRLWTEQICRLRKAVSFPRMREPRLFLNDMGPRLRGGDGK